MEKRLRELYTIDQPRFRVQLPSSLFTCELLRPRLSEDEIA